MDFKSVPKQVSKSKGKSKRENSSIKVVYISSPMKVKASASRFRAIVQELTGKHSDIATLMMEANDITIAKEFEDVKDEFGKGSSSSLLPSVLKHEEKSPSDESAVTASSYENLSKHLVDDFSTTYHHRHHHHHQNVEEEFILPPDFIYDYSWIDILNSYDTI